MTVNSSGMQVITIQGEMLKPDSPLFGALHLNGKVTHMTTPNQGGDQGSDNLSRVKQAPLCADEVLRSEHAQRAVRQASASRMEGVLDRLTRQHLGCLHGEQWLARGRAGDDAAGLCAGSGEALGDRAQPTVSKNEVISTARVEALSRLHRPGTVGARRHHNARYGKRLQQLIHEKSMQMPGLNGGTQKIVPIAELEQPGFISLGRRPTRPRA